MLNFSVGFLLQPFFLDNGIIAVLLYTIYKLQMYVLHS